MRCTKDDLTDIDTFCHLNGFSHVHDDFSIELVVSMSPNHDVCTQKTCPPIPSHARRMPLRRPLSSFIDEHHVLPDGIDELFGCAGGRYVHILPKDIFRSVSK